MTYDKHDKNSLYSETFIDLFMNDKLKAKWYWNSLAINSEVDLEVELKRINNGLIVDDFISNAFEILTIAKNLAFNKENAEVDDSKLYAAKRILKDKPSFREELYVRCKSNVNILESVDYELLTKREESNIKNIMGYSALLQLSAAEPNNRGNSGESIKSITVEMTRDEIEGTIRKLKELLELMNHLSESE